MQTERPGPEMPARTPDNSGTGLGVIVVLHRSGDVIRDCIESLIRQGNAVSCIVLVENGCPEASGEVAIKTARAHGLEIEQRLARDAANQNRSGRIVLIRSTENLGFAGGVNLGLKALKADPDLGFFWVLNPDCTVPTGAAERLLADARAEGAEGFSLMGMRVLYRATPSTIQSDGSIWCRWTGRCRSLHQGGQPDQTFLPRAETLDFVSGASMVASRVFLDRAGLMPEDYFLYYEEVDWAARRGALPLAISQSAHVEHDGGTAIGSGAINRAASPLSVFFNTRNRMRFVRRYRPAALPVAYLFGVAKILQNLLRRQIPQATAAFRALHGLPPPRVVAERIATRDHPRAFGRSAPQEKHVTAPLREPA
ncbi:MAG: glycosyltransferase family 2 protein [Pseudomonadota bacterium]